MHLYKTLIISLLLSINLIANDTRDKVISELILQAKETDLRIKKLEEQIELLKLNANLVPLVVAKKIIKSENQYEAKNVIITTWNLNVRKNPTKKSLIIKTLKMGDIVHVENFSDEWFKIQEGYVRSTYVKTYQKGEFIKITPTKDVISIRKSPSPLSKAILMLKKDNTVLITYPTLFLGSWYRLKNHTGYVHKKVVKRI